MHLVRQVRFASLFIGAFIVTWLPMIGAQAQDTPDYVGAKPPSVAGEVVSNNAGGGAHAGFLPRTGIEIGTLVILAIALIVVGRILMIRRTGSGTSSS